MWIVIAVLMLLIGASLAGVAVVGLLRSPAGTGNNPTTVRHDLTGEIVDIVIRVADYDVIIEPRRGTKGVVTSTDTTDKKYCEVTLVDGKLTVQQKDTRAWYEKLIGFEGERDRVLHVLLPEGAEINSLDVSATSGDVGVGGDYVQNAPTEGGHNEEMLTIAMASFASTRIHTTTGDVKMLAKTESLYVRSTGGDVEIEGVQSEGKVSIATTTGDMELENCTAGEMSLESTTGEISCYRVQVQDTMYVHATSGEVTLRAIDVQGDMNVKVTTGDVYVTFVTLRHYFVLDTTTGDVERECASDQSGKRCSIVTTTGDIEVKLAG